MRQDRTLHKDVRANALWGRNGESRANALWGRSGKRTLVLLSLAAMLVVPVAGSAAPGSPGKSAVVPDSLIAAATANPLKQFDVIVQGNKGINSSTVGQDVTTQNGKLKMRFLTISGVDALVSGKDLLLLARNPHVSSITPNSKTKLSSYEDSTMWRDSTDMSILKNSFDPNTGAITGPAPQAPAIAIVDSGVQSRSDFGSRLVASVNMCSLCPLGASGDDEGHGTMVAGVAAGSGSSYPGGAPNAPIVSVRTADATGESLESDVVAAADWIDAHAKQYNIRVVNFSLATADATSVRVDPLDKAVERLWLDGIVVVAAAGNFGTGSSVAMSFAPGNDPFVITVGALDQHSTSDPSDDTVPSWSAYGMSMDGFSKPDVSAPGRYMIAPIPATSTIATTVPDRIVAPGYIWMSGTSFAAPVVSAEAAQILARHPDWSPDEVKGAIMLSANYLPNVSGFAGGVGEVDGGIAATMDSAPNPNEGLYQFVSSDGNGVKSFDAASWANYLNSGASWAQASWGEASWGEASWNAASWGEASWNAASWVANVNGQMTTLASYSESTFKP